MNQKEEAKLASQNMSIIKDTKQMRVAIPEFLIEIFDINPKEDKFNWYVKRSKGKVRLMAILNKKGLYANCHIGEDKEKYFEKEETEIKENKK